MCLIIYNPKGKPIKKERIQAAYDHNGDGFGLMWTDGEGKVNVVKGQFDFPVIWNLIQKLEGKRWACHFRFRTHGKISDSQCHPFMVLDRDKHGSDVYMMHNGVISGLPANSEKSDSCLMAIALRERVLSMHDYDPRVLLHPGFTNRFGKAMDGNKFLFMTGSGEVSIVNKDHGKWIDGCWYSNTYSIKPIRVREYFVDTSGAIEKFSTYKSGVPTCCHPTSMVARAQGIAVSNSPESIHPATAMKPVWGTVVNARRAHSRLVTKIG